MAFHEVFDDSAGNNDGGRDCCGDGGDPAKSSDAANNNDTNDPSDDRDEPGNEKARQNGDSCEPESLPSFQLRGPRRLKVRVLPVVHGEDMLCLGFAFGDTERCVYLSDLSRVPEGTMNALMEESERGIDVLVCDCLQTRPHNTHFSLEQALSLVRKLKPRKTLLVGMSCDTFPPHDKMNEELAVNPDCGGFDVQFARDGQVVDIDL